MLVHLNGTRGNWTNINDDLSDLRFVANNLTLAHEVESYTVNSEACIWVKTNTSISFYMYYGNSLASSIENKTGVWASSNVMTNHMNMTDSTVLDSTSYNNDGTVSGATTTNGKIGKALSFDGLTNYVDCGASSSLNPTTEMTIMMWINPNGHQVNNHRLLEKGYATSYAFEVMANDHLVFEIELGYDIRQSFESTGTFIVNQMNFVVVTYDGAKVKFYINGSIAGDFTPSPIGVIGTDINDLFIGKYNLGANYAFNGILDEVRISNKTKTAAWIKADYYSESDSLLTYGSETSYVPPITPPPDELPIQLAALSFILALVAIALIMNKRD